MILSTAYLGNIQYYTKLLSGEAVIDLHEHYRKQSYRNRCDILTANGVCPLVVPVLRPSGTKPSTRDIRIDGTKRWQHRHFRAIASAYRSSPFFAFYEDEFAPFYTRRYEFLADLNGELQRKALEWLDVSPRIASAENYRTAPEEDDFRDSLSPKERLRRPDPDFRPVPYYQVFSDRFPFVPNLSVIDLLCCEGPGAVDILRRCAGGGHKRSAEGSDRGRNSIRSMPFHTEK